MKTNNEIIDYIKRLREYSGYSLDELARKVGMSKSSLSRYENHQRSFPVSKAEIFAGALGVTTESLLGFSLLNKENKSADHFLELFARLTPADKQDVLDYMEFKLLKNKL